MKITNKEYSESVSFKAKCKEAGVEASRRQASKYMNKKGKVWKHYHKGGTPHGVS